MVRFRFLPASWLRIPPDWIVRFVNDIGVFSSNIPAFAMVMLLPGIISVPLFLKVILEIVREEADTEPLFVRVPPWKSMFVQDRSPSLVRVDDCIEMAVGAKVTPLCTVRELEWRVMDGTFRTDPVSKVSDADCIGERVAAVKSAPLGRVTFA